MEYDYSCFAANTMYADRLKAISAHPVKCSFQCDRDRIIHSKSFRRLSGKTQVFITGFDDNMRTRLTHTIEVAQIADTIARAFGLNTVLTEAIALGHDLGHTPFGHAGERTLNHLMNGCFDYFGYQKNMNDWEKGFKHNLQGIRVVCSLANYTPTEPGLNLTRYTMWGIKNHTSCTLKSCNYLDKAPKVCGYRNCRVPCDGQMSLGFYDDALQYNGKPIIDEKVDWTIEGVVVGIADEIAQRQHDIEDGIYAGIIDHKDLCKVIEEKFKLSQEEKRILRSVQKETQRSTIINHLSELIIDHYTRNYLESLQNELSILQRRFSINCERSYFEAKSEIFSDITNKGASISKTLGLGSEFLQTDKDFQEYLKSHIIQSELAQRMDGKSAYFIRQLVKAYLMNPQQLPDLTIISIVRDLIPGEFKLITRKKPILTTLTSWARDVLAKQLNNGNQTVRIVLLRKICDYIAGMTDHYAILQVEKLYGTLTMRNY